MQKASANQTKGISSDKTRTQISDIPQYLRHSLHWYLSAMSAFDRVSAMQTHTAVSSQQSAPRCNSCQFSAESREQPRDHHKSEWHVHNSRRRAAEQPPVSRKEFAVKLRKAKAQQLIEQQKQQEAEEESKRVRSEERSGGKECV